MMDELRDLYQEVILDHGKHPRNFRHPAEANRTAKGYNPLCGDKVEVYLSVTDDGTISDAAFEGRGCAISIASASMMTEILRGKGVTEAEQLFGRFHDMCTGEESDVPSSDGAAGEDMDRLQVLSGVREFPARVKCATLAWHAMNAALSGENAATTE